MNRWMIRLLVGAAIATVSAAPWIEACEEVPAYREIQLAGKQPLVELERQLGEGGLLVLQKVNRRDLRHMKSGTTVLMPSQSQSLESLSPFPSKVGRLEGVPKAILVSLRVQAFAGFEFGRQVRWGPVSTGTEKQPTPANLYHTNWRSRRKVSTINSNWIMPWYFNLHTSMGVAFHEYEMPGYPASYGCIRLLREDARWIFNWAEQGVFRGEPVQPLEYGTPVIVFGSYDYGQAPPWKALSTDPWTALVSSDEVEAAVERYHWVIERREAQKLTGR